MYYRPHYLQKTIHLALLLSLLAFAARVLGQDQFAQVPVELGGSEKFVPGGERFYAGATLEVRGEVNVIGEEVKLKQVARWNDTDKAAFEPIADLVLFRLTRQSPYRTLTVRELRDTLHDAGVNLAVLRLAGATQCTVSRTDVKFDERTALDEWIAAKELATTKPALIQATNARPAPSPSSSGSPQGSATVPPEAPVVAVIAPKKRAAEENAYKSLRDHLTADMAERLSIPAEQLQFHFNPADDKVLNLTEPHFAFKVTPRRKSLGEMTWDVTVVAEGQGQKATVNATVRAWQNQLVVNKPLGYRQVIRDADLIDRRTLVDQLSDDPLVTREQVVGQMAGRDLKSGTVLTARLIEPTILVKTGQLVTVTLTHGAIQAKSVARSTEQGTMGQTIRVKNEVTNNMYDVVITGPQTARLPAGAGGGGNDVVVIEK